MAETNTYFLNPTKFKMAQASSLKYSNLRVSDLTGSVKTRLNFPALGRHLVDFR